MKNHWLKDKIVAKGYAYWTYEIYNDGKIIVPEAIVAIDECPSMKVVEKLEVEEGGKKVWKPVLIIWEKFEATYTDPKFLENHAQIRLLEVNGEAVGILRHYDESGESVESWVMHGLRLTDIDFPEKAITAEFTFHHALYLTDDYGRK